MEHTAWMTAGATPLLTRRTTPASWTAATMPMLTVLVASALLGLTGCSNLSGSTYIYGSTGDSKRLKGVPFTLNKPVPTVVHTPATDDKRETYTTTFAYAADSSHRYTLTVDPSHLASIDFSLSFDTQGSFTEGSAKTTDQSAAVLTSVVKLGLAVFDSSEKAVDAEVARLIETGDQLVDTFDADERAAWTKVKTEMKRLQTETRVKAEYVYTVSAERAVLRKIYDRTMAKLAKAARTVVPVATDTKIEAPSNPAAVVPPVPASLQNTDTGRDPKAIAQDESNDAIAFAIAVQKVEALKNEPHKDAQLSDAILHAMRTGDVAVLSSARANEVAVLASLRASLELTDSEKVLTKSQQVADRIGVLSTATDAIPRHLRLAKSMAELSPSEWRRRTVVALNSEIDAAAHTARVQLANDPKPLPALGAPECTRTSGAGGATATLCQLRQKKAIVLGVSDEYRRRNQLAATLEAVTTPRELKLLREEIAALDATISEAETSLKAKPKEPKAEDPYAALYVSVQGEKDDTPENALVYAGLRRPKYVILARSLEFAPVKPKAERATSTTVNNNPVKNSPARSTTATTPGDQPKNEPKPKPDAGAVGGDLATPGAPAVPPKGLQK